MSEKKDNWERLIHLPDEYEHDPAIAQRAIEKIEREKAEKKAKEGWWKKHWRSMAVSLATCAVVLAVALPVYHSLNAQIVTPPENSGSDDSSTVYFDENQITFNAITDVSAYVQEQGLALKYFAYQTATTHSAVISETNEFAFLKQEMLYIDSNGFDKVKLYAVVMADAEFDFEKFFNNMNKEVTVLNLVAHYTTIEEYNSAKKQIYTKFSYESVEYYLEINTTGEAETKIEQYVNMLVN